MRAPALSPAVVQRDWGTWMLLRSATAPQPVQIKWTWGSVLPSKRSMPPTVPRLWISPCALNRARFRYTVAREMSGCSGWSISCSISAEGCRCVLRRQVRMASRFLKCFVCSISYLQFANDYCLCL